MKDKLTHGDVFRNLIRFSVPYLISCFLQTFYGLADLLIVGRFDTSDVISAVSVGSQVMHMITVVIVGLTMGTTVLIGRSTGSGNRKMTARAIGSSSILFAISAAVMTIVLFALKNTIIHLLQVPSEAVPEARTYLIICFAGIPLIVACNVISSIFRGLGDTRTPLVFVLLSGIVNLILDLMLVGGLDMGAAGAASATVAAQACSVLIALAALLRGKTGVTISRDDLRPDLPVIRHLLSVGVPIACQEGLIQVSFLLITMIANTRGVSVSAAVGIVEKIISFLFLVPSAMQAAVTTLGAQCIGAGTDDRARKTLSASLLVCSCYAMGIILVCELTATPLLTLFAKDDPVVTRLGAQYLRTYVTDTFLAGLHFCMSGFFTACNRSLYSFIHNIIAIAAVRIPGAILATALFPSTLYALGLAAPAGSLLSDLICLFLYLYGQKKKQST